MGPEIGSGTGQADPQTVGRLPLPPWPASSVESLQHGGRQLLGRLRDAGRLPDLFGGDVIDLPGCIGDADTYGLAILSVVVIGFPRVLDARAGLNPGPIPCILSDICDLPYICWYRMGVSSALRCALDRGNVAGEGSRVPGLRYAMGAGLPGLINPETGGGCR